MLIEDLLIEETYLPSTLISLDLTFSENLFDTSIKVFDADITFRDDRKFDSENINKESLISLLSEKLYFLKNFNVVELINSKLQIYLDNDFSIKYFIDLNIKNKSAFILLSEFESKENFITINFDFLDDLNFSLNAQNFKIDFARFLSMNNFYDFDRLKISGESRLVMTKDSKIDNFYFNLFLDGKISYNTNFDKKILTFNQDKLNGIFNDNELSVSLNFKNVKSIYSLGVKTKLKNKSYIFFENRRN